MEATRALFSLPFSKIFQSASIEISGITKRVHLFFRRYQKEFLVFGLEAGFMFLAGNRFSRIVLSVIGGLGWHLGYSKGAPLPEDFLEEHQLQSQLRYSYSLDDSCSSKSVEILRRILLMKELFEKIAHPISKNWNSSTAFDFSKVQIYTDLFIIGETGSGKTEILHCIGDRLVSEGNLVYHLKKNIKIDFSADGSSLFTEIQNYLNCKSMTKKKRVYLLIDELVDSVSINRNLLSGIKDTKSMNFSIIAAMVKPSKEMTETWSELSRRYVVKQIDPLDPEGIYEIERRIKEKYESVVKVSLSDEIIEKTVQMVQKNTTAEEICKCHSRVSVLLNNVCRKKRMEQGPGQTTVVISEEDIVKEMKKTEWHKAKVLGELSKSIPTKDSRLFHFAFEIAYDQYTDVDKVKEALVNLFQRRKELDLKEIKQFFELT